MTQKLTINGREYDLKFGVKALAELDTKYMIPVEGGMTLPMGLQTAVTHLQLGNVSAISNLIQAGTGASERHVATFLESEDTDIDEVFEILNSALEEGTLTKKFMNQMKEMTANQPA